MTVAVVLAATGLFVLALERSGIAGLSYRVLAESNGALRLIADPDLDDDAKEIAIRRRAVEMLGLFGRMVVRIAAIVLAPVVVVSVAVEAGATDLDAIWQVSLSWPMVLANCAIFVLVMFWPRRA